MRADLLNLSNGFDVFASDTRFQQLAQELGHDFSGEIKIGGNYTPVMRDGH